MKRRLAAASLLATVAVLLSTAASLPPPSSCTGPVVHKSWLCDPVDPSEGVDPGEPRS